MKIAKVLGREIYDSRGNPTIECEIVLENGAYVTASVPSGLSVGSREAFELRDGGTRLLGKGVMKAIEHIENDIGPALIGQEPDLVSMDIEMIELDGTTNKERFGANAILAVSIAVLRAQAYVSDMEPYELVAYLCGFNSVTLPFPLFNVINGGVHADNNVRMQEIMVVPVGAQNFRHCMEGGVTLFNQLKAGLKKKHKQIAYGDEGGLAVDFKDDDEALDMLMSAIEKTQKETGLKYLIALDAAASQFYNKKKKKYEMHGKSLSNEKMIAYYLSLVKKYPIFLIEDGLQEDDWDGWIEMNKVLADKVQIVGDDITTTCPEQIAKAIEHKALSAVVIKPNQIGTVTETLQAVKLCKDYDILTVASHRSGETNDTFIVDLAVGGSSSYIKAGGCTRGERLAKYNELMRIEDVLMLSLLDS